MRAAQEIWRFISSNSVLSAAGNIITFAPYALGALALMAGLAKDISALALIGIALLVLNTAWLAHSTWRRRRDARAPDEEDREAVFTAVAVEISNAGGEGLRMHALLTAERPWITPKSQDLERAISDWRDKTTEFLTVVLGPIQRAAFANAGIGTYGDLDQLKAEADFLCEMSQGLTLDSVRATESEVLAARTARQNLSANFVEYDGYRAPGAPPPVNLPEQLDALMREGIELLDELMAPAQPEETGEGEWSLEFGDAPREWRDKANAFYKRIRDLLIAEYPALIPDFESGYNERLRKQREAEKVTAQQPDKRTTRTMLDFATDTQRTPAKIVEACLEGLSYARKSL